MTRTRRRYLWLIATLTTFSVGVMAAACWYAISRVDSGKPIHPQISYEMWYDFDGIEKVGSGVRSVLLETTQLSTSAWSKELSRSPLYEFQYDKEGRIVKWTDYRDDGIPRPPSVYEYDSQGKLLRINHHNTSGVISSVISFTYDDYGRPLQAIKAAVERGWESELSRKVYAHDPARHYSEITEYWDERLRDKRGYVSDEAGHLLEVHRLSNMVQGEVTLKYMGRTAVSRNESGDVVREEYYDNEGRLNITTTYEYVHDSHGNWVKRTESTVYIDDGKYSEPVKEVYYRIINYY